MIKKITPLIFLLSTSYAWAVNSPITGTVQGKLLNSHNYSRTLWSAKHMEALNNASRRGSRCRDKDDNWNSRQVPCYYYSSQTVFPAHLLLSDTIGVDW